MEFNNIVPKWDAKGKAPSADIQANGFKAGYKPPAAYFNYMFNAFVKCLSELQESASSIDDAVGVERARIDNLLSMDAVVTEGKTYELTAEANENYYSASATLVTNGMVAVVHLTRLQLKLGEGSGKSNCVVFELPEELKPLGKTTICQLSDTLSLSADEELCAITFSGYSTTSHMNKYLFYPLKEVCIPEIIDARIGANGVTYPNIGEAIRTQLLNTNTKLNQIEAENAQQTEDMRGLAPAIRNVANGEALFISDSAAMPLQGLKLYGKSVQSGTPSPENPAAITSAGESGSIKTMLHGGNLLPYAYHDGLSKEMNGITFTVREDGSILVNGTATESAYFTFNATSNKIKMPNGWLSTSTGTGYGTEVQMQNDIYVDGTFITSVQTATQSAAKREFYGDVKLGASRIKVNAGVTVKNVVVYPMLCNSYNVLPYEKNKELQTLALSTPNGLCGIPVSSGGNYTDENGQQWLCDEIDLERGIYVQRVNKITLANNLGWTKGADDQQTENTNLFYGYIGGKLGGDLNVLCDKLPVRNVLTTKNDFIGICTHPTQILIYIRVEGQYTVEEFKEWIVENPISLLYPLIEPVETALTDEEIAAYKALRTHSLITTAVNDGIAGMELSYVMDEKAYIDKIVGELVNKYIANQEQERVEESVREYLSENPVAVDPLILTDTATKKKYKLSVVNGNLTMEEVKS